MPAGQPVAGGPTTGGDAFLNINSWQVWWQLNHPRYVGLAGDTKDADRRDVAMPALVAALRDDQDSDVLSASLIALGKVAVDHPNLDVLAALRAHLPDGNQDVREAAILALGLSGIRAAAPDLASLLHDERPGRKLIERSKVGERARTFAAYSLGLLAQRTDDPDAADAALAALLLALDDKGLRVEDVLTGVLNGVRLLAAIAIGLGLAGADSAADTLREIALETKSEVHKGHLLVGLAMLDDKQAATIAEGGMTTVRNAVYMGHCALALAELGRRGASTLAVDRLQNTPNTRGFLTWLGASAQSIGHLKNARDLPALVETLQSRTARKSSSRRRSVASVGRLRAAITAAAMGSVADRDPLGFGARIADGMNYTMREQTLSNGKNGVLDIF